MFLRFTHNRKSKYVSLCISINPRHWDNERKTVSEECPDYQVIRYRIEEQLKEQTSRILSEYQRIIKNIQPKFLLFYQ
ncbi:hypothetical protein FACS1894159_12010 [Bacteroidia bacterium]|nr:hypothetical protein FACS1894159_12010 [Bacteroidia bacterium]